MRYCPTCSRSYEDDTAAFCLKDATPLVDGQPPSQVSVAMLPGQPQPTMAPTPPPQNPRSQNFDSIITPTQVFPVKFEDTLSPSENRNDDSQVSVAPDVSDQPKAEARRMVFDLGPASPAKKSQPSSQPKSQPASQAKSPAKSRLARKRRLLLLLVMVGGASLVIVGVAGVFFWWQHYKSTPAYDLALLVDAVHRNDTATIDKIAAMDKITDTFASDLTQSVLSQNNSAGSESRRKQIESSLTGLTPNIKQRVREEVDKQLRDQAARSEGKSFLLIALAMPYKVAIKEVGDTAKVDTQGHPTELTMQRSNGDLWTIIAVKDDALASSLLSKITEELPTVGGKKNSSAATKQGSPTMTAQQRTSTAQQKESPEGTSRAKKKGRKTLKRGIEIELKPLPWPE